MATVLDKQLRRQVTVDGADYTLALDPDGFKLIGKGRRTPQVELLWRDLLNGDAALAVALNASVVGNRAPAPAAKTEPLPEKKKVPRSRNTKR